MKYNLKKFFFVLGLFFNIFLQMLFIKSIYNIDNL